MSAIQHSVKLSADTPNTPASDIEPSLQALGVYGFNDLQPVVWASLASGDPLLLIGNAGTGKTFLLNSLSEALGLEHRHYNASLISFDDLVGFPYPSEDNQSVHYLPTPATVWDAQSVLIDEINRCKPEHQNRLFSLVHERKVQGIALDRLEYRWAALNPPPDPEDPNAEVYDGVEPLDRALADRFAFLIKVPDWHELSNADKYLVADPSGTGRVSDDDELLPKMVVHWKKEFESLLQNPPRIIIDYACIVADQLKSAEIRLSPRRVRQIARNLLALIAVTGDLSTEKIFLLGLQSSIPQVACGDRIEEKVVRAAHTIAWELVHANQRNRWLLEFRTQTSIVGKVEKLCEGPPDPDTGSIAISQALSSLPEPKKGAFAFSVYPAAAKGYLGIGAEGVHALSDFAGKILEVDGDVQWRGTNSNPFEQIIKKLESRISGARLIRARQLFAYFTVNEIEVGKPFLLEKTFNEAVQQIARHTGLDQ